MDPYQMARSPPDSSRPGRWKEVKAFVVSLTHVLRNGFGQPRRKLSDWQLGR